MMTAKLFEDAVQSATVESVHADYIITRNLKDFTKSKGIYTNRTLGKNLTLVVKMKNILFITQNTENEL